MTQQATVLSSLCRLREPRQGCCLSEHAALLQFNGLKRLGLKLFQIVKYSNPILHMTLYMGLANSLHSIWQLCQHVQVIRCNTTKNFSYTHLVRPNLLSGQIKNLWNSIFFMHYSSHGYLRLWAFHFQAPGLKELHLRWEVLFSSFLALIGAHRNYWHSTLIRKHLLREDWRIEFF